MSTFPQNLSTFSKLRSEEKRKERTNIWDCFGSLGLKWSEKDGNNKFLGFIEWEMKGKYETIWVFRLSWDPKWRKRKTEFCKYIGYYKVTIRWRSEEERKWKFFRFSKFFGKWSRKKGSFDFPESPELRSEGKKMECFLYWN